MSLEKNIGFSVDYGGALCHRCNNKEAMNISPKILKILQYFATNDFYDIIEIDIHTTFLKKIDILLYKYLCYYLEKNDFKSLKFLNLFKED
jgi:DNA repair protein RecO